MKHYIWDGESYDQLPNPLKTADGSMISPVSEELFQRLGGVIEEDGEPTHFEELCDACDTFIEIVLEIADKIEDPNFWGGINQQSMLRDSQYAKDHPTEALTLAERWNGADKACNFFADKPDLYDDYHSPKWYYFALSRYINSLTPTEEIAAPAEEPAEESAEEPTEPAE